MICCSALATDGHFLLAAGRNSSKRDRFYGASLRPQSFFPNRLRSELRGYYCPISLDSTSDQIGQSLGNQPLSDRKCPSLRGN